MPSPAGQIQGFAAAGPDPAGPESAGKGRPRSAGGDQGRQKPEKHSGGGADHFKSRRGHFEDVRPACELLYHQAGRFGAVCNGGAVYRGLLAGHRAIAAEWETMNAKQLKVLMVEDNPADAR